MTRQFRRKKQGKNGYILGIISHCVTSVTKVYCLGFFWYEEDLRKGQSSINRFSHLLTPP